MQMENKTISYFQSASLVASPSYPNSVAWSDENLVAVASGHLVTILNPSSLIGARGLITVASSKHFPIGVINREDLLHGCLLPTCLSRETRPCVRSISWSHLGLAPNFGCLLAVCTTAGCVKLYRSPYCEFSAEWIEVKDISDSLFAYLSSINFGEVEMSFTESSQEQAVQNETDSECCNELLSSMFRKKRKRKITGTRPLGDKLTYDVTKESEDGCHTYTEKLATTSTRGIIGMKSEKLSATNLRKCSSMGRSKEKPTNMRKESGTPPLLTAKQYASRNAMLSSLTVAWSPPLHISSDPDPNPQNSPSNECAILAVGGKHGNISFWRTHEPQYYTIDHSKDSLDVDIVGLLQAHNSWITAICWGPSAEASESQVLLATGSSDGSVKMWVGEKEVLRNSSGVISASFSLLQEVTTVAGAPVSVLSMTAPIDSPNKISLGIGRGSGSLEVWICDILNCNFSRIGLYDTHGQVVTGLSWAFGGGCLYSCSMENSVRCWSLNGSSLREVPIPSNFPGIFHSTELSHVSDSCFGVAISPGNLVIAVVRGFDTALLNPMYQARTQKAAVEFFWNGGYQHEVSLNGDEGIEAFSGISRQEMIYWESNIFWSLKQYEKIYKPLVLWDIITALSALKESSPKFVESILIKWFSSWVLSCKFGSSTDEILLHARSSLPKIHSRQIHLLNILCRRLMLSELKPDDIVKTEKHDMEVWIDLLNDTERQLRERLVAFSLSSSAANTPTSQYWATQGAAQMEQWADINHEHIQDHLNLLISEVQKQGKRIHPNSKNVGKEHCSFCSASVPFDSPEVAYCVGEKKKGNAVRAERHKLSRCAASMQVCPLTPLWFCVCCRRWVSNLPPDILFKMSEYPSSLKARNSDLSSLTECSFQVLAKPFCPFCGILLQRLQPEFLLSASPV